MWIKTLTDDKDLVVKRSDASDVAGHHKTGFAHMYSVLVLPSD